MNARELIQRYTLDVQDLPNQSGMNVVTIAGLEVETFTPKGGGTQVPQTRKKLHFRELSLPLGLNNIRIEILINMLGEETDSWRGRKIGLFVGATTSFGVTKKTVFVHLTPMDSAPGSGPPQLNAAAPAVTNPEGPIGEANAKRFTAALAEQGATFDDFLHWLKRTDRPAHDTTIGLDLPDLKRSIAPLMHRFLREYQNPPAAKPVEKPRELVEQAADATRRPNLNTTGKPATPALVPPEDDIPF